VRKFCFALVAPHHVGDDRDRQWATSADVNSRRRACRRCRAQKPCGWVDRGTACDAEVAADRIADLEQEQVQQLPEVHEYLRQQARVTGEAWLDTRLPRLAIGRRAKPRVHTMVANGSTLFAEFACTHW